MNDIFISYAPEDMPFVHRLDEALRARNLSTSVDWKDEPPSADRFTETYTNIEATDNFVFIVSPDSMTSRTCQLELAHAIKHHKRLIALCYRDCENGGTDQPLHADSWVDFRPADDFDVALQALIDRVTIDADWVHDHTCLLVRAIAWDQKNHDPRLLLGGRELEAAENWLTQSGDKKPGATSLQTEYILASRQAITNRQRLLLGAETAGLIIISLLALVIFGRYRTARSEATAMATVEAGTRAAQATAEVRRQAAEAAQAIAKARRQETLARQLAAQAQLALNVDDPIRGTLLAIESLQRYESAAADQVLRQSLSLLSPPVSRMVHEASVNDVAISPDGRWLATGTADGQVRIWEMPNGQEKARISHEYAVNSVAFSPDGTWLAAGTDDGTVHVQEIATGEEVLQLRHDRPVSRISFDPQGRWLVSASDSAHVWDLTAGREVAQIARDELVTAVAFSSDGRWLATAGRTGTTQVWEADTGRELGKFLQRDVVRAVAFSPNDRWLATGSLDGTARVWEIATGRELRRLSHPTGASDQPVYAVMFSPNGKWLATASEDSTARVWDISSGRELAVMSHARPVLAVTFSPDGNWIATGSEDNTARLWEAPTRQDVTGVSTENLIEPQDLIAEACRRLPRNLTRSEWQAHLFDEPYHTTCPDLPTPPS